MTYPVQILWVDEVWRAKAGQPGKEVAQSIATSNRPSTQARVHQLIGHRIRCDTDACIVEEHEERCEGDQDIAGGNRVRADARGNTTGQHAQPAGGRTKDDQRSSTNPALHGIDTAVNTYPPNAGVHDRVLKCIGDASNAEEVGLVANKEPHT